MVNPHRWRHPILTIWSREIRRPPAARPRRRRRPGVEAMESRQLLTTIAEFPITTVSANPDAIASGPDGDLWFAEFLRGKVGVIDPVTHTVLEFSIPTAGSQPAGIAAGPDGDLWFTEQGTNKIGEINPTTHAFAEFPIPTANSGPTGITTGPDGDLWFTEVVGDKIGTINPATHAIAEFVLPTAHAQPGAITAGPDGDLWFTEGSIASGNQIGQINPKTHAIAEFPLPVAGSVPAGITTGPDGDLWFTETDNNKIGIIDPTTHSIVEVSLPTVGAEPIGITAGSDGNLWFGEADGNQIGSINPITRRIAEFPIPTTHSNPRAIAAGPDGGLWFVETFGENISELTPTPGLTATAEPPASITTKAAFGLTVTVTFASGVVDTAFDGNVTLALLDPGGATLGGTLTVAAHDGVAMFSALTIDRPGRYQFVASTEPLTATVSRPVTVSAPPVPAPPAPVAKSVPPTIVAERAIFAGKGRRGHVVGYELDFSAAMDAARATSVVNYTLTQSQRRGRQLISHPVGLHATYDATAHSVTLTLSGKPKFAQGGKLVVAGVAPGGLTSAAGVPLDGGNLGVIGDDGTFVVAKKGSAISR